MATQHPIETPNPEWQAMVDAVVKIEQFIAGYENKFIKPTQIIKPTNGK